MFKMVLAGLRPEIVMDVTNLALTFWQYQMCQELQYQKALNKSYCDSLTQAEETYTTEIMKLNSRLQMEKRNREGKNSWIKISYFIQCK
jgi:E3 ubiquitin-protein ligase CCNP1IP1